MYIVEYSSKVHVKISDNTPPDTELGISLYHPFGVAELHVGSLNNLITLSLGLMLCNCEEITKYIEGNRVNVPCTFRCFPQNHNVNLRFIIIID